MTDDKLLTKIAALLRQAEGTDNEHEAATFTQAAQRLATASSIDLAVARAHDPEARKRTIPVVRKIRLGERRKRGLKTYVELFLGIGRANDLKFDIAHNSTYVVAYGYEADIDATEALYASLVVQMVAASNEYIKAGDYKEEKTYRKVSYTDDWGYRDYRYEYAPMPAITARLNFQNAFADRIAIRLSQARNAAREEALARDREAFTSKEGVEVESSATSTAIALRNKEVEVHDFHAEHSTARGSWKGSSAPYSHHAQQAGDRAGKSARLGSQGSFGAAKGALTR